MILVVADDLLFRSRISSAAKAAGVVVRDQRAAPQLGDALRITVGSPEQNDRVLSALNGDAALAAAAPAPTVSAGASEASSTETLS